jgi:hypothetical protein
MNTKALLTTLAIGALCQFAPQSSHAQNATIIQSDYIGQTWLPLGDSIEITSVERTDDQITVKGHYTLASHDTALLALYITSSYSTGFPEDKKQTIKISRGSGDFELIHPHLVVGLPHVSMYGNNGHPFAAIYFGTKEEAAEEARSEWITNSAPVSTP